MITSNQQKREEFKKLPEKIREIILSPELSSKVSAISIKNKLPTNAQTILSEVITEILTEKSTRENLKNMLSKSGLGDDIIQDVIEDLDVSILRNLDSIYQEIVRNTELEYSKNQNDTPDTKIVSENREHTEPKPEQPRARVAPVGFEEAILNQARAMRPAEPVDGRIMNQELRIKQDVPHNLPTDNTPKIVHDYRSGNDPYREPLE